MAVIADRRLWLDADRARVVEDGDPAAAFLLAAPGRRIQVADADRLGLSVVDGRVVLPGAADYGEWDKADLEAEAEARGLDVEGTGASGNVLKADLVRALEADDGSGG